jgi:hypothetical protein
MHYILYANLYFAGNNFKKLLYLYSYFWTKVLWAGALFGGVGGGVTSGGSSPE